MANQTVYLDFITHLKDDVYKIEGYLGGKVPCSLEQIKVMCDGAEYTVTPVERPIPREFARFDQPIIGSAFEVQVSLPDQAARIDFVGQHGVLPVQANRFTGLARRLFSSRVIGDYRFSLMRHLLSRPATRQHSLANDICAGLSIVVNWQIPATFRRLKNSRSDKRELMSALIKAPLLVLEAVVNIPLSLGLRGAYFVAKRRQTRPIWIVSDRGMAAGDNGEALFRYMMSLKTQPADIYFALSKKSPDYARLAEIGRVLNYGSLNYKLKFLLSDMIVSSHADSEVTNPFGRQLHHFVDLLGYRFVFLQHGVIHNDLSEWLGRYEQNIDLFITSGKREYDSILDYPYYYSKSNVLLSGLPRYDYLQNNPSNKLIFAPTYRAHLLRLRTDRFGRRAYDAEFKKSDYFKFYNSLINDQRLQEAMERYGYIGEFYVHPNFATQVGDFTESRTIKVQHYPYDYKKAISEGALLVSDFSSLPFDFAYLNKPVVYSQFDSDTFYAGHSYAKGEFFSDQQDGFGPVVTSQKAVVDKLIAYMKSGCVMEDVYRARVKSFFAHHDTANSERVYQAIVSRSEPKIYNRERV